MGNEASKSGSHVSVVVKEKLDNEDQPQDLGDVVEQVISSDNNGQENGAESEIQSELQHHPEKENIEGHKNGNILVQEGDESKDKKTEVIIIQERKKPKKRSFFSRYKPEVKEKKIHAEEVEKDVHIESVSEQEAKEETAETQEAVVTGSDEAVNEQDKDVPPPELPEKVGHAHQDKDEKKRKEKEEKKKLKEEKKRLKEEKKRTKSKKNKRDSAEIVDQEEKAHLESAVADQDQLQVRPEVEEILQESAKDNVEPQTDESKNDEDIQENVETPNDNTGGEMNVELKSENQGNSDVNVENVSSETNNEKSQHIPAIIAKTVENEKQASEIATEAGDQIQIGGKVVENPALGKVGHSNNTDSYTNLLMVEEDVITLEDAYQGNGQISETPKHIAETPEHIQETLEHIQEAPKHISETSEQISETPERISETPKHIPEIAEQISETPEHILEKPAHVSENTVVAMTESENNLKLQPEPLQLSKEVGGDTADLTNNNILSDAVTEMESRKDQSKETVIVSQNVEDGCVDDKEAKQTDSDSSIGHKLETVASNQDVEVEKISEIVNDSVGAIKEGELVVDEVSKETLETKEQAKEEIQISSEQKETPEISSEQINTPQILSEQIDTPQISSEQIDTPQTSSEQIDTPQISSEQIDIPQISSEQIDTPQTSSEQIDTPKISSEQIDTPQISSEQIDTPQISSEQIDTPQSQATEQIDKPVSVPVHEMILIQNENPTEQSPDVEKKSKKSKKENKAKEKSKVKESKKKKDKSKVIPKVGEISHDNVSVASNGHLERVDSPSLKDKTEKSEIDHLNVDRNKDNDSIATSECLSNASELDKRSTENIANGDSSCVYDKIVVKETVSSDSIEKKKGKKFWKPFSKSPNKSEEEKDKKKKIGMSGVGKETVGTTQNDDDTVSKRKSIFDEEIHIELEDNHDVVSLSSLESDSEDQKAEKKPKADVMFI